MGARALRGARGDQWCAFYRHRRLGRRRDAHTYPPALTLPPALAELLHADAALRAAFAPLPPSAQRAWAAHISTAKRAETVARRLAAAQVGILARQYP